MGVRQRLWDKLLGVGRGWGGGLTSAKRVMGGHSVGVKFVGGLFLPCI